MVEITQPTSLSFLEELRGHNCDALVDFIPFEFSVFTENETLHSEPKQ